VQFTHFVDFMIMMPLGEQLMRAFQISTAQFSALVATYAWAAALTGFAGGFVLDRFDPVKVFTYGTSATLTKLATFTPFGPNLISTSLNFEPSNAYASGDACVLSIV